MFQLIVHCYAVPTSEIIDTVEYYNIHVLVYTICTILIPEKTTNNEKKRKKKINFVLLYSLYRQKMLNKMQKLPLKRFLMLPRKK